jgi:inner membrane protein
VVRAALAHPDHQGLVRWLRLPAYFVEKTDDGYRVRIEDVRYSRTTRRAPGRAVIDLDRDLRPR